MRTKAGRRGAQPHSHGNTFCCLTSIIISATWTWLATSLCAQTFTSFAVPECLSETPISINGVGDITGTCESASGLNYGFLRAPDGTLRTFTVPEANVSTQPVGINEAGVVAGVYGRETTFTSHGFLREPDGTIVSFDPPGSTYTAVLAINAAGTIIGWFSQDHSGASTAFIRRNDGRFTLFSAGSLTIPIGINDDGVIVGSYVGGFFSRFADGSITTFSIDGCNNNCTLIGVSQALTIAGYTSNNNQIGRSFVRMPDGTVTFFDAPGVGIHTGDGTFATAINRTGDIVGSFSDSNNVFHGFLRRADGTIRDFSYPGAAWTVPNSLNAFDIVTGFFIDPNSFTTEVGFVLAP
jgi:uncharacterized membrane protein